MFTIWVLHKVIFFCSYFQDGLGHLLLWEVQRIVPESMSRLFNVQENCCCADSDWGKLPNQQPWKAPPQALAPTAPPPPPRKSKTPPSKQPMACGVPGRSHIQVLTTPSVAQLQICQEPKQRGSHRLEQGVMRQMWTRSRHSCHLPSQQGHWQHNLN